MRYFNTEGVCRSDIHYMVRLDDRLEKMKRLYVDRGKYFIINKGRQYGKTTTLRALAEYLLSDYFVVFIDFQGIGTEHFISAERFSYAFAQKFLAAFTRMNNSGNEGLLKPLTDFMDFESNKSMLELFIKLSAICQTAEKPIALLIDEVDSASNNQVFVDFLSHLREYYLNRENTPVFQSVILAGVYDVKNLKLKIRPDSQHQYNSPWNIAADFTIDMNFSVEQIAAMLKEYEAEQHTGMDIQTVSKTVFEYTAGYPYLVSAICKLLDEEISMLSGYEKNASVWTNAGIAEAVKRLLNKQQPLFQSMIRQLNEYPELKQMLSALLFQGKRITFNIDNPVIELASMFGYIVSREGSVQVANRIFEMRLYGYFLSEEELSNAIYDVAQGDKNLYIQNGKLNMDLVLEKFVLHFSDIYGGNDEKFLEVYGRKLFLLYLRPIINGTGNYYVEAQTRDAKRTDVIVDYLGEQFIVELKIWRGNEYNERGEKQIIEYLDYYHQNKGYLLSFNFNKKKETGVKELRIGDKTIVEAVV
ncbi:MAG: AAA-like domain-containing protein [Blautia sp.]|nr:AAA-like domain-containing protein [Blautia sp.]MCM1200755.1 AAA-like domain-containing protein [Bacteroides fragilis]